MDGWMDGLVKCWCCAVSPLSFHSNLHSVIFLSHLDFIYIWHDVGYICRCVCTFQIFYLFTYFFFFFFFFRLQCRNEIKKKQFTQYTQWFSLVCSLSLCTVLYILLLCSLDSRKKCEFSTEFFVQRRRRDERRNEMRGKVSRAYIMQ